MPMISQRRSKYSDLLSHSVRESAERYFGRFGEFQTAVTFAGQQKSGRLAGKLVVRHEQVFVTGDKKSGCQGSRVRPIGIPQCVDALEYRRTVRVSGFHISRDFNRWTRGFGAVRKAYRSRRSIFDGCQQDVTSYSRRRRVYEARRRGAPGDNRFYSRFHWDRGSSDLCRSRRSFSDLGAVCIVEDARRNPARADRQKYSFNLRRGNGMVTSFDGNNDVDGGPVDHIPVLLSEVIKALEPSDGKLIFDGTFGAGGYSTALLERGANVIATDQDPDVIDNASHLVEKYAEQLSLKHAKFSQISDFCEDGTLDGVVLDIGVSSMQIDQAERGFSFMQDGPLDMRMAQDGVTAADVVNRLKLGDLARIFGFYGEEKKAGRLARAIVDARAEQEFHTTGELAKLIEKTSPRKMKDRIHPATRVFQALRIYVNDELGELARSLLAAEKALKPGGRLVVVTFHSLEDRIVKKFFADRFGRISGSRHLPQVHVVEASFEAIGKKGVISASDEELAINPRSRSAKLRAGIRTHAPAGASDMKVFGLPDLYPLHLVLRSS